MAKKDPLDAVFDRIEKLSPFHRVALGQCDILRQAFFMPDGQGGQIEGYGRVYFDPKESRYVINVTPRLLMQKLDTQVFIFMHEIEHVLRSHLCRPKHCTPRRWNIAGDICINDDLIKDFINTLAVEPQLLNEMCTHARFNIDPGVDTIDEVYRLLPPDADQQVAVGSFGSDDIDSNRSDSEEGQAAEAALEDIVRKLRKGQGKGHCPNRFKDLLAPPHVKKVNWKAVLQEAFGRIKPLPRPAWSRINNRKYASSNLLAPGVSMPRDPRVYVAIDTSGSCIGALPFFFQELNHILDDFKLPIDGCFIDTQPHEFKEVTKVDAQLQKEATGGGGTDFSAMYQNLIGMDPRYDLVIMMTDTFVEPPPGALGQRTIVLNISGMDVDWAYCEMYNVEIGAEEF